jgi:hypothetical protein
LLGQEGVGAGGFAADKESSCSGQVAQFTFAFGAGDFATDRKAIRLGQVAQLVEHTTENRGVDSSILSLAM